MILRKWIFSFIVVMPFMSWSQAIDLEDWANQDLFGGVQFSLHLLDASDGSTLSSFNADQYLIPASNMKLFTTAAAFDILGPEFRFPTTVGLSGSPGDQNWKGNLWIKGGGNPCWNSKYFPEHTLESLAKRTYLALRQNGIKEIEGDLVLDFQNFDQQWHNSDWSWADIGNYYGISSSAFNINDNEIKVRFNTTAGIGEKANIESVVPDVSVKWHNEVTLGPPGSGDQAYVFGNAQDYERLIRGSVPKGGPYFEIRASLPNPNQYFAEQFIVELQALGLQFVRPPKVILGKAAEKELLTTHSPRLYEVIRYINRESNNLFAEAVYKYLLIKERQKLEDWKATHFDNSFYQWKDGCGLSAFNRCSAKMLTSVLFEKANDEMFIKTLAAPEEEGTLKYRLKGLEIRAKTGSIEGVYTLSGYLRGQEGRLYVFSLMLNNYHGPYRKLYEQIQNLLKSWSDH